MTDKYLKSFSECTSKYVKTMFGLCFQSDPDFPSEIKSTFSPPEKLVISIPFNGSICGEYFLSANEKEWAFYFKTLLGDGSQNTVSACFKELLNTIVGDCFSSIQSDFHDLIFLSPRVYRGTIDYPEVITLTTSLQHKEFHSIHLALSINMVKQNIGIKLQEACDEASVKSQKIESIMNSLKEGTFSIDKEGNLSASSADLYDIFPENSTISDTIGLQGIVFQPETENSKSSRTKKRSMNININSQKGKVSIQNEVKDKPVLTLTIPCKNSIKGA